MFSVLSVVGVSPVPGVLFLAAPMQFPIMRVTFRFAESEALVPLGWSSKPYCQRCNSPVMVSSLIARRDSLMERRVRRSLKSNNSTKK